MDVGEKVLGKRERTRAQLLERALELFERQGFEQTTVAQIAAAARVTEMTLYRHFPAKELLVLDDPYDPVIVTAVADQPPSLAPLVRVVNGLRAAWGMLPEPAGEVVRRRVRIVAASPALRAAAIRNNEGTERLITQQLVADGATPLPARVAAVAVLAAITAALFEWSERHDGRLGEAITTALDTLGGDRD
ncbi:TetR/AcrR family transcriptional regulator [Plantactinospora soyae]|uniref:AcrR family transcriptional regulator n=1 Tax=Plantactinospora soyae TaxID=1544732 RepID=A0A927M9N7_9ACTN|nr:helix-turn-helix domain-containing protein [Plantactinospora soyae]MBE1489657.1 AcrR family transcriptional regulator [Plantactinospora soyae]